MSDGSLLYGNAQYVFTPGEYVLRGTGGSHVDFFQGKLQFPELLKWTNMDSIASIDRNSPVEVRWTGGGANDRIIVQGLSAVMVGGSEYSPEVDAGSFICAAPPASKSFTVPAEALKLLAASGSAGTAGALVVSAFAHGSRTTFKTALKQPATDLGLGTELGLGTFGHMVLVMKQVNYR
jgi:hypothetical protein